MNEGLKARIIFCNIVAEQTLLVLLRSSKELLFVVGEGRGVVEWCGKAACSNRKQAVTQLLGVGVDKVSVS